MWHPIDWKTPIGYIACASIPYSTMIAAFVIYVCSIALTIRFSMLIADFVTDIRGKMCLFDWFGYLNTQLCSWQNWRNHGHLQFAMTVLAPLFPLLLFYQFGGNIIQQFEDFGDAVYQL